MAHLLLLNGSNHISQRTLSEHFLMPSMPQSHLLANQALTRVQNILADAEALSEVITNDYGEDLLVQTQLKGMPDDFKIFIQVKGRNFSFDSNEKYRLRVGIGHLRRWVNNISPVIVCVFNKRNGKTYYCRPDEQFSLWYLSSTRHKTASLSISKGDIFDNKTAINSIWSARVKYYSDVISLHEGRRLYFDREHTAECHLKNYDSGGKVIVLNFLKSIDVITGDEFSGKFRRMVKRGAAYFSSEFGRDEANLREVFGFILMGDICELSGNGAPANLTENCTELAGYFFKTFHPNDWKRANSHFSEEWKPYRSVRS